MESTNIPKDKQGIKSKDELKNLKSDYFLQKIFDHLQTKKSLEIFKYNKKLQKRLNININNYKEYSEIYSSIYVKMKKNIYIYILMKVKMRLKITFCRKKIRFQKLKL